MSAADVFKKNDILLVIYYLLYTIGSIFFTDLKKGIRNYIYLI